MSPFETTGSAGQRTYKYTYDKSDKLKAAAYRLRSLTAWDKDVSTLDESMT